METAFLETDIDKEIIIKLPPGMEEILQKKCVWYGRLHREIYGLVQEYIQFYIELYQYFTNVVKLKCSVEDPCLFANKEQTLFIGVYVDDMMMIGEPMICMKTIDEIKNRFNITYSLG